MKIEKCDVCGFQTDKPYAVSEIYEQYRPTDDIKHVCESCDKEIRKVIGKFNRIIEQHKKNWVKKFISKLKVRKITNR